VTVFVVVDNGTTECLGIHAAKKVTRFDDTITAAST
jgi:hypothetical protein